MDEYRIRIEGGAALVAIVLSAWNLEELKGLCDRNFGIHRKVTIFKSGEEDAVARRSEKLGWENAGEFEKDGRFNEWN